MVILMLDYFRSRYWWSHALWLVPVLLMTMNVIHTQEAVFAFFMGLGMIFVMEGQWIWTKIRYSEVRSQKSPRLPVAGPREPRGEQVHHAQGVVAPCGFAATGEVRSLPVMNMLKIHVFFVGGLCLFGLLLYYSLHKPIGGYSEFVLRPLFHSEWLGQKWFIQPLAGQFVQVVTWWGVFVYVLFLLYARNFRGQPFIWAGMLMPCLTVFNPLTLAILSRWIPDLNAIYRFNYMIPLPFVAVFLAMRFSNEIKLWIGAGWRNGMRSSQRDLPAKHAKGRENIIGAKDIEIITTKAPLCDGIIVGKPTSLRDLLFQKMSFFSVLSRISRDIIVHIKSMLFLRKIWAVLALLGLVVLLMPFEPLFGMKSNSRFYTLKPVPEGNDHRRWGDLIAFVRTHPQGQVLTDGYTSILLHEMGLTATDGDWWIRPSAPGADRLGLLRNLDRRNDWWLVVNRRNGDFSMNGYQSGHWPADVLMRFTSFYPEDLILFIKQHPELFKEIWSNDQIQVYDIVESRLWE
ncbi:MAG: hypothetical protein L6437_00140 [Kiritimatiellae bacterium]|nr:hypothetical protein [Kiritimatiellia bacterium]